MKEKLQCDNCGGVLDHEGHDIFACKYCGMKYKITGWVKKEETLGNYIEKLEKSVMIPSKYNVIGAKLRISDEVKNYYSEDAFAGMVKRKLADNIANYIYNNFDSVVECHSDTDICTMQTTYTARMRVLKGE